MPAKPIHRTEQTNVTKRRLPDHEPSGVGRRYTVISCDGHAGANVDRYREYLDPRFRDEYDAWLDIFAPRTATGGFDRERGSEAERCWTSDLRASELLADGVVAEVLFPNTIPPFSPGWGFNIFPTVIPDLEHRWAGIRAFNRWMVDFCADLPGRRRGLMLVDLTDVDELVNEVRWAAQAGLAGLYVPKVTHHDVCEPLYSPSYEPLWAACAETGMVVSQHGGLGDVDFGQYPASWLVLRTELDFWEHRGFGHILLSGVFERHPDLKWVITEQGAAWVPDFVARLDEYWKLLREPSASGRRMLDVDAILPKPPSEYCASNVWFAISFMTPEEGRMRHHIGVDHMMWGQDYPHMEGTFPHSREAIQAALAGVPEAEVAKMLSETPAAVYGFDLAALEPLAAAHGPLVEIVAEPLTAFPGDDPTLASSPAFQEVLKTAAPAGSAAMA